VRRICQCHDVR